MDDNKELLALEIIQALHDKNIVEAYIPPEERIRELMESPSLKVNNSASGTISKVFNKYLESYFVETFYVNNNETIGNGETKEFKKMRKLYANRVKLYKKFQDLVEKAFK
jgi:hypothetical protein